VDVEATRTLDPDAFAGRVLSGAERIDYSQAPARQERQRMLLRAWTAKEAVLKGMGVGLDLGMMSRITIPLAPSPGRWQAIGREQCLGDGEGWHVLATDLPESTGAHGLVALASPAPRPVAVIAASELMARHALT
jgi:hypothetical protein